MPALIPFKKKVKNRLAEAQPSDLLALQRKIYIFRADLTASLAAPVILPKATSSMLVLNLFAPDMPINSSLEKKPCMDEDPMDRLACVRIEVKDLERALRESRREAEIRRAQEEDQLRSIRIFE